MGTQKNLSRVQLLPEPPPERGYAVIHIRSAAFRFSLRDALTDAAARIPELQLDGLANAG